MFNQFFKGNVDSLLNHVLSAPKSEIDKVGSPDEVLNHEEIVAVLMDEYKFPLEEAERRATEIQIEEFNRIAQGMVQKGLLEIVRYDENGDPVFDVTELGKKVTKLL